MFFIQLRVRPAENSPNAVEYGGAYANCWVQREVLSDAMAAAIDLVHDAGWQAETVEEERQVFREEFNGDGLEYFDQAVLDNEVCVFHTWPIDSSNAGSAG